MSARIIVIGLLASFTLVAPVVAQDNAVAAGEKLYTAQCKLCHGNASASQTGERAPPSIMQPVRLAMRATVSDAPHSLGAAPDIMAWDRRIAFAPPFGPNLRGVYGRPAGAVEGFQYSIAFMKTLKGMEWNDAALDVWITSPQAWVPGVYMFYKQPDAEIRRQIILYLKANR